MAQLLVADNSPFYRKLLSDALEEKGHRVRTVADGLEALQALESDGYDAVVLDLVMPRLSGARACRQIKADARTREIPVVILSGLREDEIDDAQGIGADAFVAKMQAEAMVSHLMAALDELLHGRLKDTHRGFDRMHRREVVSELLEERRSRDAILNKLSEGYLRVSEEGLVVEANPAAARMLRRGENELVNRHLSEVLSIPPEAIGALLDPSVAAPLSRIQIGTKYVSVRSSHPEDAGPGPGVFLLLADVTDEARAEAECRSLQEQVEASERFSALGEIVAGVAHELNNPLTGLLGYSELLLKLAPDERSRGRLSRLHHEALRCRRIVENLLCFARKRQAYPRLNSLNEVVVRSVRFQEVAAAKAGVSVQTDLQPDLPPGLFDMAQLEQVVGNLLSNSFQALASRPAEQRRVRVSTALVDGRLRLNVHDTGPGIAASLRESIFEPFVTTRRPEGGTGLGLAVSYGIISEHQGTILVADEGPGACLQIELPVAENVTVTSDRGPDGDQQEKHAPAVLLVDDEPVVLDLLEDVLTDSGYRVSRALNGAEALERLETEAFDAMLIDIKMPDMDGRRLYRVVCERRPGMAGRVVFTTGETDRKDLMAFMDDAGATLLRKPFELEQVADTFDALTRNEGSVA